MRGQKEDFNLWAALDLETHLNKRLTWWLNYQTVGMKMHTPGRNVDRNRAEIFEKMVSAGIAYRFENKADEEPDCPGPQVHRLVAAEAESDGLPSFRNKFQTEYLAVRVPRTEHSVSYDRTRIKVDYNIRKSR